MGKTLFRSTTIATLPGDFTGVVFSLAVLHDNIALLGLVAAHTSLRAMWGAMHHHGYSHAYVTVMQTRYRLSNKLAIVEKGIQDGAEWWLLARPNVVPNTEVCVRAYVGRRWPLPPQPLLPILADYTLDVLVGNGEYLAVPDVGSDLWKPLIQRAVLGDAYDEFAFDAGYEEVA